MRPGQVGMLDVTDPDILRSLASSVSVKMRDRT
jgi:hypothetical protein